MGRSQAARKGRSGGVWSSLADLAEGLAASERTREIVSLGLLGMTVFVALACLSAGRGDNLCGPSGEALAGFLMGNFGHAAWLVVLCFGLWGVLLFTRSEERSLSVRGSGLLLCLVSTSALLAHLFGDITGAYPAGGMVGEYINGALIEGAGLGTVGTLIILLVLTLMTFVLAADVAVSGLVGGGVAWVGERLALWREEFAEVREKRAKERAKAKKSRAKAKGKSKARPRAKAGAGAGTTGRGAAVADDDPSEGWDDGLADDDVFVSPEEHAEEAIVTVAPAEAEDQELLEDEPAEEELEADDEEWEEGDEEEEWDDEEDEEGGDEDDEEWEDEEDEEEDPDDVDGEQLEADDEEEWEYEDEEEPDEYELDSEEEYTEDDVTADPALALAATGPKVREMVDEAVPSLEPESDAAGTPAEATAYVPPPESLLDDQEFVDQKELDALLEQKTATLEETLASFRIEARCVEIQKGPVISMFEMELAPGIKVERLRSLEDDLAIALKARSVRIVAPIPGKSTVGIEVPNPLREMVRLKPLLHCREYDDAKVALPIFLGRDAAGRPMVVDLAKMPHLLVAGATGSGKSVCLNTIICSLLFKRSPEDVQLILLDPKMVEMSQFGSAPHLACPVVNDMKRAPAILEWAVNKMEERYRLLSKAGVRNIYSYNSLSEDRLRGRFGDVVDDPDFPRHLPFIVIIVDELADLMMTAAKDVETSITRLAAKSRAVGIHIILATQRPSTNVITGLIKANLPTRVAFMVSSKIDSRVILDSNGAEQLLGEGDMLFLAPRSSNVMRGQCTFMSEEEVRLIMEAVGDESGPHYEKELVQRRSDGDRDPTEVDDLYDAAVRFMIDTGRGSASLLQRKFAIGYTRASRLIDLMAEEGVLGEYKGSQARDVQLTLEEWVALNPEARESEAEGAV